MGTPAQTNFMGGSLGGALRDRSIPSVKDRAKPSNKAQESSEPVSTSVDVDTTASEVPEGTTAEVLAWVGEDRERAQQALDAEKDADKPRSTLTRELEKIVSE